MSENFPIYETDGEDIRYVLGSKGGSPLFAIGVNCSTADNKELDPTLSRVEKIAGNNGFDSFIMLNLYPLRKTDPKDLPPKDERGLIVKNAEFIYKFLKDYSNPTVLACWGTIITQKDYLKKSLFLILEKLKDKDIVWKAIKLTDDNHPHHPLYAPYGKLIDFDIEKYVKELGGSK